MYRVYNCDQEGSKKAKPFYFLDFEPEDHYWESGFLRSAFALLLIVFK